MSNTILVHGTYENHNRADRIALAIACTAHFKFSKKVLVLPMTNHFELENVLMGERIKANAIKGRGISFNDNGIDALLRRLEQGTLKAETFSDCCFSATRTANGLDIAPYSKKPDADEFICRNENLISLLINQASNVYDVVIVLADGKKAEIIGKLGKMVESELTIISQGCKAKFESRPDTLFAVNNYDGSSEFTYKEMKKIYGIEDNAKLYPVPYNIRFKDACRKECAIDFMTANIEPDQTDENYVFIEDLKRLTSAVLKTEAPLIKELNFAKKETSRRK